VLDGLATSPPVQNRVRLDLGDAVGRLRLAGLRGDVHEADFAEAILAHHAPTAVDGQTHVPSRDAAEINGCIGRVSRGRRGLGELDIAQNRPVGPILRVLHGHTLEPEAKNDLELHVVVPDQKLMELVDAIKFVLDVQGLALRGAGQPHVVADDGVLAGVVESGTVDGILRSDVFLRDPVARGDDRGDGIGERLGGEAPDLASEDRVVRCGVHFVDPPVVGRFKIEPIRWGICRGRLALTDEQTCRRGPDRLIDIVKGRAEVDIMRRGEFTRRPAQNDVARDVGRLVGWIRIGGQFRRGDAVHSRTNFSLR